jgi:hypothetical protein
MATNAYNYVQTYDLQEFISGNTWQGIDSITITRNGSALDLTGAYAQMNVKFHLDSPLIVQFNTNVTVPFLSAGYGAMTILAPASAGNLRIPPQIVSLPPANYIYSIRVTLSSGEVDTFVTGHWPVIVSA